MPDEDPRLSEYQAQLFFLFSFHFGLADLFSVSFLFGLPDEEPRQAQILKSHSIPQ